MSQDPQDIETVKTLVDGVIQQHVRLYHAAGSGPGRFKPPTREELVAYCQENNLPLDVDKFLDFHTSKGWKVGRVSMKDWRAAARNAVRDGWCRADGVVQKSVARIRLFPIAGKNCSTPGCKMPAVYKKPGGQYDHYACSGHMPDDVKERYE